MNHADVAQVAALFKAHQIQYWLIGGMAIDLILGYESRPHKDIDFFVAVTHYDKCVTALQNAEFTILPHTLKEEGVFLQKDDVLVDITKVLVDENGRFQTFGTYADVAWPTGMSTPYAVEVGDGIITTLTPQNHVAMKTAVAAWLPDGQMRPEDKSDLHNLKANGLIPTSNNS